MQQNDSTYTEQYFPVFKLGDKSTMMDCWFSICLYFYLLILVKYLIKPRVTWLVN